MGITSKIPFACIDIQGAAAPTAQPAYAQQTQWPLQQQQQATQWPNQPPPNASQQPTATPDASVSRVNAPNLLYCFWDIV